MSTINGLNQDEKATAQIGDQVDANESSGVSKLKQTQQRYDHNQQLHFTQV